jgi:PAS domain S-box-containing protein
MKQKLTSLYTALDALRSSRETLQKIEAQFDVVMAETKAVIYSYKVDDGKPEITYVSKNVFDMLGFKPEEVINNFELLSGCIHPDDLKDFVAAHSKLLKKGKGFTPAREFRVKDKNGSYRWLCDEKRLFEHEDGTREVVGAWLDITNRRIAEEKLKEYTSKFEEQKSSLEQKDMAFKEVLEYVERAKNELKEDISININEFVLPALEKLKVRGESSKYIDIIHKVLKELASPFGRKITQKSGELTPKEIEICGMLKGGLSSKEISNLLNVSLQTVEKHRKNVRKKLGLSNKGINLTSYLQNL